MSQERLQKILSRAGISSRRKAEELILSGKVKLNGRVVRELGVKADPKKDKIDVAGKRISFQSQYHYYAYYKPRGVVVSKKDELGRRSFFESLKLPPSVNAVGRLDKESEGLLLLTDDGEFLYQYTHPSFGVSKFYHIQVSRRLSGKEIRELKTGIVLDNKTLSAVGAKKFNKAGENWLEVELQEGIKREIRRMLETFEVKVLRLIRIQHGGVKLGRLRPGEFKVLEKRPEPLHLNKPGSLVS